MCVVESYFSQGLYSIQIVNGILFKVANSTLYQLSLVLTCFRTSTINGIVASYFQLGSTPKKARLLKNNFYPLDQFSCARTSNIVYIDIVDVVSGAPKYLVAE